MSVDLDNSADIIRLIEKIGDSILGIKIHSDIISGVSELHAYLMGRLDDFVIIEDCKVADISFISLRKVDAFIAYTDFITYHCLLGDDLPRSLKKEFPGLGCLGVIEMSAGGCLIDESFMRKCKTQLDLMDGCVIQKGGLELFKEGKLPVTFSPGISLQGGGDGYNQTYRNPLDCGGCVGDFWIVGRGIYMANDAIEESGKYKNIGWNYFMKFHK